MEDVLPWDALAITVLVVTILSITVSSLIVVLLTVLSFTSIGIVIMAWEKGEEEKGKGAEWEWGYRRLRWQGHQVEWVLWGDE